MKWHQCLALAGLILGLPGLLILGACSAPGPEPEPRAAIIDQLSIRFPNQAFLDQTAKYLAEYGYMVDIYIGDAITVDMYRELPAQGYEVIIFRVHSGLLGVDPKVADKTWLYTNEPYSKTSHIVEQFDDQVTYAKTHEDAPWYFAISAKFIENSLESKFNETAIIMMGCDCLRFEDFAQAFIKKGASTYIAWDASVMLHYVDAATLFLVEKLCSDKLTVKEAVDQTMDEKGADPDFGAVLRYYPEKSGRHTLAELIK